MVKKSALLEETYKDFVRSGALLNEDEKAQIREINEQLSSLTNEFRDGLMSLTQETVVFVDDKEKLAGLSDSRIESLANAAKSRDKEAPICHCSDEHYTPVYLSGAGKP